MVASISARGNATAALAYYDHLRQDDYYSREGEPPGRWGGGAAARLSLKGPVTQSEFDAALNGIDPKTGERLVQRGGQAQSHAAGWDMTFSAPKSVSVLWALSEPQERAAIEAAQRTAVIEATRYLEKEAAWSRRGQGGRCREQAACLLVAQFDHHTSRELDPQLHTHCFVFNMAPRKDGSWGAIVSKELYKAQKNAGAVYRNALAQELEQQGHRLEREGDIFRVAAIPKHVERAFSKRRQAIEKAAGAHGYTTAKGMELAALRTRRAKENAKLSGLFDAWRSEAGAMNFHLPAAVARHRSQPIAGQRSAYQPPPCTLQKPESSIAKRQTSVPKSGPASEEMARLGAQLHRFLRSLCQPSGSTGIRLKLRQKDRDDERD
ncbi:MAG: MobF family relaxase [Kiloniellaceae bacterium]